MDSRPISAYLIPKLLTIKSGSQTVARLQSRIIGLLNPSDPINMQHQIKSLWHRDRVVNILRGNYQDVTPVTVEFVPSLDCNYSCPACTYGLWKKKTIEDIGRRQMSYEVMMTLLDKIEDADVKGVIFTGGGEPFRNPDAIRGLEYASRKNFDVGLFTNGSLLDETTVNRLANAGISFIRVSFNSGDAANYNSFHMPENENDFGAAKRNIRLLAHALAGKETNFGLGVIVNKVNVDYMHTVAEFVREIFSEGVDVQLKYIAYRPVVNYGQLSSDRTKQISDDVCEKARTNFEKVKAILKDTPVIPIFAGDYFEQLRTVAPVSAITPSSCIGHSWGASIAYDGGVYLCSERDGNTDYLMGNLLRQTFGEIWTSQRRNQVITGTNECPPMCKMHRTSIILNVLTSEGSLKDCDIEEIQNFLDVIRGTGNPGGPSFI